MSGVITVARHFPDLLEPYVKERIPDVLGSVDHSLSITDKKLYKKLLKEEEAEFNVLVRKL